MDPVLLSKKVMQNNPSHVRQDFFASTRPDFGIFGQPDTQNLDSTLSPSRMRPEDAAAEEG